MGTEAFPLFGGEDPARQRRMEEELDSIITNLTAVKGEVFSLVVRKMVDTNSILTLQDTVERLLLRSINLSDISPDSAQILREILATKDTLIRRYMRQELAFAGAVVDTMASQKLRDFMVGTDATCNELAKCADSIKKKLGEYRSIK